MVCTTRWRRPRRLNDHDDHQYARVRWRRMNMMMVGFYNFVYTTVVSFARANMLPFSYAKSLRTPEEHRWTLEKTLYRTELNDLCRSTTELVLHTRQRPFSFPVKHTWPHSLSRKHITHTSFVSNTPHYYQLTCRISQRTYTILKSSALSSRSQLLCVQIIFSYLWKNAIHRVFCCHSQQAMVNAASNRLNPLKRRKNVTVPISMRPICVRQTALLPTSPRTHTFSNMIHTQHTHYRNFLSSHARYSSHCDHVSCVGVRSLRFVDVSAADVPRLKCSISTLIICSLTMCSQFISLLGLYWCSRSKQMKFLRWYLVQNHWLNKEYTSALCSVNVDNAKWLMLCYIIKHRPERLHPYQCCWAHNIAVGGKKSHEYAMKRSVTA